MSSSRIDITLPDEIIEILKTKKNKSKFMAEAIYEKLLRDKKNELKKQANYMKKYYMNDKELTEFSGIDYEEFRE